MAKLQVGDYVLVTGPSHYEKATVISVEKNQFTLDNHMVIDKHYNNMVKSSMTAEPWDEEKFTVLRAEHQFIGQLHKLEENFRYKMTKEQKVKVFNKLLKINQNINQ